MPTVATGEVRYATIKALRRAGANVIITARSQEAVEKAAQELDVNGLMADIGNTLVVHVRYHFSSKFIRICNKQVSVIEKLHRLS